MNVFCIARILSKQKMSTTLRLLNNNAESGKQLLKDVLIISKLYWDLNVIEILKYKIKADSYAPGNPLNASPKALC